MTPNIPSNPNNIPVTSGDGIMALFDFKFGKFISPSLIRWLYVALLILLTIICIVMELGSVIGFLGSLFDKNTLLFQKIHSFLDIISSGFRFHKAH